MISAVNNARPDVLWVGMTAPKQEKWIYENQSKLQGPFIAAIGAVFDFYAGTKKRSSGFCVKMQPPQLSLPISAQGCFG